MFEVTTVVLNPGTSYFRSPSEGGQFLSSSHEGWCSEVNVRDAMPLQHDWLPVGVADRTSTWYCRRCRRIERMETSDA